MNGLKYKLKKCISLILPIFLLGSISPEPFFSKSVEAAEIGMVGALPGSVTIWEIFQTIWAASGIIIANEEVQTAAASNFGSSSYSLSEMVEMGFTPIGVDGSNALDWDWSGLEDELENSDSEDAKIIKGIFSQNGGSGSGGNDQDPDEDPWYRKAVNWVKNVVEKGKVSLTDTLNGATDTVTLNLGSLSGMISAAFQANVDLGIPLNHYAEVNYSSDLVMLFANDKRIYEINLSYDGEIKSFYNSYRSGSSNTGYAVCIGIKDAASQPTYTSTNINLTDPDNPVITTNSGVFNLASGTDNCYYGSFSTSGSNDSSFGCRNGVDLGRTTSSNVGAAPQSNCINWLKGITDPESKINVSPDLITPYGNAVVPNGNPAWVPTPYIDGDHHLEILPQPQIDEFTQYIIEENPEFSPAGDAWIDTVSPYVTTDPTPAPTQRPQPTTNPNITPIPAGDPGSEENPIFTAEPDPMPDIEDGFGTTFDLMDYFPFCIPSDLVAAFKVFEVSDDYRQAPYIDWNLKIDRFGIDEHIVLDFSTFDSAAALFRILIFISFCISLIVLTKTLIWS